MSTPLNRKNSPSITFDNNLSTLRLKIIRYKKVELDCERER